MTSYLWQIYQNSPKEQNFYHFSEQARLDETLFVALFTTLAHDILHKLQLPLHASDKYILPFVIALH